MLTTLVSRLVTIPDVLFHALSDSLLFIDHIIHTNYEGLLRKNISFVNNPHNSCMAHFIHCCKSLPWNSIIATHNNGSSYYSDWCLRQQKLEFSKIQTTTYPLRSTILKRTEIASTKQILETRMCWLVHLKASQCTLINFGQFLAAMCIP